MVCQNPSLLLIAIRMPYFTDRVEKFNLVKFENIGVTLFETIFVYQLAISSGFVYAACSDFIVKFDSEGNIVKRYNVDGKTKSVTINKSDEIISSSCSTHIVTIIDNSGEKLHSYFHAKLKYPYGLDVNFSGNIFVAGRDSNNIHVLTPKADLLKVFEIESPMCIKFKDNSNICFVGSDKTPTKVYEFQDDLQK